MTWLLMLASLGLPPGDGPTSWTFEDDGTGAIAKGFTSEVGRWEVVASGEGRALAQLAANERPVFNIALAREPVLQDVELTVRLKPVSGEIDQGGGLVWRAQDAKNYYIARYNPLEDNLRLYHIVEGKRTQLGTVEGIDRRPGWHTLAVTMRGDQITVALNGMERIEVRDATLAKPGRIGLWTKADARTEFDDLRAAGR